MTPLHNAYNPLDALIPTEQANPRTVDIDQLSTDAVLCRINDEDQGVALAVAQVIPQITPVVDAIVRAFAAGGRLLYFGAGTSGRLGVLDASECPPTYGSPPDQVQAFIAGGDIALRSAVEGAEDSDALGAADAEQANLTQNDVVVGISASGGAPYVLAAMRVARSHGATTAAITCHGGSPLALAVDWPIIAEVGPEVVAGSTRMKAGTAQKLILNMLTTGAMIQSGKTYRNLMVDVQPTNRKLRERARRMVALLGDVDADTADRLLAATGHAVKPAVLIAKSRQHGKGEELSVDAATERLQQANGKLRPALDSLESSR